MSVEFVIIIIIWVVGILSFLIVTPKNRRRKLILAFLICKTFTWISTLLHVKFNLIIFPIREFPKATDLLITTQYFFYPLMYGFYIIFEPKLSLLLRILYLSLWTFILAFIDLLIEKYTNLIEYVHYTWYWKWLSLFCLFSISNTIYHWFFKDKTLFKDDKRVTE